MSKLYNIFVGHAQEELVATNVPPEKVAEAIKSHLIKLADTVFTDAFGAEVIGIAEREGWSDFTVYEDGWAPRYTIREVE